MTGLLSALAGAGAIMIAMCCAYVVGWTRGRLALLAEQGREAEAIWAGVKAEMDRDEKALGELCAILGPREVPE